jgi:hypothetical protein
MQPVWANAKRISESKELELGRRGGLKGGKARAAKMTPKERSELTRKVAKARWAKKRRASEGA